MRIEVRWFGGLADRVGGARSHLEVPDDATVADLRAAAAAAHPHVAPLLERVNVAVDLEVAGPDRPLAGAREVAMLPPVAGGAGRTTAGGVRVVTGLSSPPLEVEATIAAVSAPDCGGTAVFLGTVRDHAADVDDVVRLDYSAYDDMAERVLDQIADELADDHPALRGLALLHATGELAVGEHTVLIVCAAPHRAEAFAACEDALERVKDRVPIWKREVTADGAHRWVGLPATGDADAAARTDDVGRSAT
jgi:MoaE-MoaD fusion protein